MIAFRERPLKAAQFLRLAVTGRYNRSDTGKADRNVSLAQRLNDWTTYPAIQTAFGIKGSMYKRSAADTNLDRSTV